MGRQFAIAFALLVALGVLAAAMAWSTSARGDEPAKPEDVQRVERAVTELGANEGYATFFAFGHSLRD